MRTSRILLAALLVPLPWLASVLLARPGATEIAAVAGAVGAPHDWRGLGREMTERFRAGEITFVWQRMTPAMKDAMGSEDGLRRFRGQVVDQIGTPVALVEETVMSRLEGFETYRRVERFDKAPAEVVTEWTFDAEGRIAGFFIVPVEGRPQPAESPYLDHQTKSRLRLPFDGAWYVFWGGREATENYHVTAADQRFAYDFLVRVGGASHSGDGKELADYYCWDQPIVVPAAGEVVAAVDGLPDHPPGELYRRDPFGNHVVLDLGEGEYAVFAHLRRGSVSVAPGKRVIAGQPLGRCGNSGHSSEPHLHFHLQDGPDPGQGHGLPAFFTDYLADGETVERGEPVRGQTVDNARPGGVAVRPPGDQP